MAFEVNDQVTVRRKMRNGNLIRMGSIVRLDGDKALVNFPLDYTQTVVPVDQLEKTNARYSTYSRVQASAIRRGIFPVRHKA
jgi:hypothetical protein